MKRICLSLLAGIMVLMFIPQSAFAEEQMDVKYLDRWWDGSEVKEQLKSFDKENPDQDYQYVTADTKELTDGWWVCPVNLTISNRLKVSGDVKLIITGSGTLNCKTGISVPEKSTLTVYGTDDKHCVLNAEKQSGTDAVIGGDSRSHAGKIIFKSGTINASTEKGEQSAGIGGAAYRTFEKIEIYGGNVTAAGGKYGPGIGNGTFYTSEQSGEILIYGGTVNANGNGGGAGIGGGRESYGVKTTIYGGDVTAVGGTDEHGGGDSYSGAGIGGGHNRGQAREIAIYGGKVTAIGGGGGEDGEGAAGIGGGQEGSGGKVTIGGIEGLTPTVTAKGGEDASGIGGGDGSNTDGGNVFIYSGTVEAIANNGNDSGDSVAVGGHDSKGSLKVGDYENVSYASSQSGAKTLAGKNERASKAQSNKYA